MKRGAEELSLPKTHEEKEKEMETEGRGEGEEVNASKKLKTSNGPSPVPVSVPAPVPEVTGGNDLIVTEREGGNANGNDEVEKGTSQRGQQIEEKIEGKTDEETSSKKTETENNQNLKIANTTTTTTATTATETNKKTVGFGVFGAKKLGLQPSKLASSSSLATSTSRGFAGGLAFGATKDKSGLTGTSSEGGLGSGLGSGVFGLGKTRVDLSSVKKGGVGIGFVMS